jgi:hypothetical protein
MALQSRLSSPLLAVQKQEQARHELDDSQSLGSTELESCDSTELESCDSISVCSEESEDEEELFSPLDTLVIFDWDDTLLPSHWLRAHGLELEGPEPSEQQWEALEALSVRVAQTLREAASQGTVLLITNAGQGWVELSCAKFMPSLLPLLQSFRIVSARSRFEPQGVQSPAEWKRLAFQEEISRFYRSGHKNLVSIGDSPHERDALVSVAEQLDCCAKAVKLADRPSLEALVAQHEVIGGCVRAIVQHSGNLDMHVQ